jgi:glycolate oxidase
MSAATVDSAISQSIQIPWHELQQIAGPENVLSKQEDLITYSFDGTAAISQLPGCVVFVTSAQQVSQVLKLADRAGLDVVTRGSGTGLSGGSVPSPNCIVMCTVRMDKILELDKANLTMLVEPGVTTIAIADAAAAAGLFYPPDPGSMKISTIGGNVAENSGGLRGLKYGVTRNYVMGMEVVLPQGDVMWLGNKCVKDVAGYSLKDLFIGSEGTLGVLTKVLLRLIPKPQAKISRQDHRPLRRRLRENRPSFGLRRIAAHGDRRPSRCRR